MDERTKAAYDCLGDADRNYIDGCIMHLASKNYSTAKAIQLIAKSLPGIEFTPDSGLFELFEGSEQ